MFESLDFIYLPAKDFEAIVHHDVENLGGELIWRVRGMETVVAQVRLPPIPRPSFWQNTCRTNRRSWSIG